MKYHINYTLKGGNLSNFETLLAELVPFSNVMNSEFENLWVLTGSGALKILYKKYLEANQSDLQKELDFPVNDLDFLVFKDKSQTIDTNIFVLPNNVVYNTIPEHKTIMRSKTFQNQEATHVKSFDLTYTNIPISAIVVDDIPIIHPSTLLEYYSDLNEGSVKHQIIRDISEFISQNFERVTINNKRQRTFNNENINSLQKIKFDDDDDEEDDVKITGKLNFFDM